MGEERESFDIEFWRIEGALEFAFEGGRWEERFKLESSDCLILNRGICYEDIEVMRFGLFGVFIFGFYFILGFNYPESGTDV